MKKILAMLLVCALLLSCFSMLSFAQTTVTLYKDNVFQFYLEDDGRAHITHIISDGSGPLNIPISLCWDDDRIVGTTTIQNIELDDNDAPDNFGQKYAFVKAIDDAALLDVQEVITSIRIPKYLVGLNVGVLHQLDNLNNITVVSENEAFSSAGTSLYNKDGTKLLFHPQLSSDNSILSTVTSIEEAAFENSSEISSITIPAGVKDIPNRCFYNSSITSLDLTQTQLETIGAQAFAYCDQLTTVTFPASLNTIGDFAFFKNTAMYSATFDEATTALDIGVAAFADCPLGYVVIDETTSFLQGVILNRGIASIGDKAFGYTLDEENNYVKNESFVIVGYKYNEDKSATTGAYQYMKAAENSFKFYMLDDALSVQFTNSKFAGVDSEVYLYQKVNKVMTRIYTLTSTDGTYSMEFIPEGRYNVYYKSKFGVLIKGGTISIDKSKLKDTFIYADKNLASPIGDVNEDNTINIADVNAMLLENAYGTDNADYDLNYDGTVDLADITLIFNTGNFGKKGASLATNYETPTIPM